MDILRPAAAGFFFILALLVLAAVFHRSWWAEELLRPHGIRPTAPDSKFRRRDFFRAAGLALGLSLVFLGLAFAAYSVAE